ncbi:MAG TPA: hypothetical protein VNL14_01190 [Candidatus Acidoferrales bacterium]|nr:hypothetical protein [Candidatus Acidoferrales bacterium]
MFVENYRDGNAAAFLAGGEASAVPYARISDEEWRVWRMFLPHKSEQFERSALMNISADTLELSYGIPFSVTGEMQRAAQYFDRVEIWRKRALNKDPIAVGVRGNERYLIARWGLDKLIPFEQIKKSVPMILAFKYGTSALGALGCLGALWFLAWGLL